MIGGTGGSSCWSWQAGPSSCGQASGWYTPTLPRRGAPPPRPSLVRLRRNGRSKRWGRRKRWQLSDTIDARCRGFCPSTGERRAIAVSRACDRGNQSLLRPRGRIRLWVEAWDASGGARAVPVRLPECAPQPSVVSGTGARCAPAKRDPRSTADTTTPRHHHPQTPRPKRHRQKERPTERRSGATGGAPLSQFAGKREVPGWEERAGGRPFVTL
jgi:hypothetical protein